MDIDQDTVLAQLVDDLRYSYKGVFDTDAITKTVHAAWDLLAPHATVRDHLPVLVARQAREQLMATAQAEGRVAKKVPELLFVCVHNAGRSQMAAAYTHHLSGGAVEVRSAGSAPADQVNPSAVEAMAEEGIDITAETPKILTPDAVQSSDVVITMGCGDTCPIFPGKRYEDWELEDPAGKGVDSVRPIRDDIKQRVLTLLDELGVTPVSA